MSENRVSAHGASKAFKKSNKIIAFLLMLALLCLSFAGCFKDKNRHEATITGYFDTVITVVAYMEGDDAFDKEIQQMVKELEVYDGLCDAFSDYKNENNIKTINDKAGSGEPVKVNLFLLDMLLTAKKAYEQTNGAVNVAMGSVTEIWRAYIGNGMNDESFSKLPSLEKLQEAAKHTDINNLIIDSENSTVYLADSEMRLDVGAFAKGYAASLVLYQAQQRGVKSMLLNMGGAISAIGTKDGGDSFVIGVQDPRNTEEQAAKIKISDLSVSTSGDYQRCYTVNGIRFHHIIDPKTLMPTTNAASVTVLSSDPISGDYLSTALMAMPYSEGAALVESLENVEAMWMFENGEKRFSKGFEAYTVK